LLLCQRKKNANKTYLPSKLAKEKKKDDERKFWGKQRKVLIIMFPEVRYIQQTQNAGKLFKRFPASL
jgi:hypothetical protein